MKKELSEETQRHMAILGKNVKRLRTELGLSQEELARKCGHDTANGRSWTSKIEKGVNDPPASELKLLAKALGVSCIELMKDPDETDQREKACEMFKKCYGQDAFRLVQYYLELNPKGQDALLGYAKYMTTQEEYFNVKKESSKSLAM